MTDSLLSRTWRRVLAALAVPLTAAIATGAIAQGVTIKSAELLPNGSGYALEANYDVTLTSTLEDMLHRGITLTFVTEFELLTPRWWTFNLWNRTVADYSIQHRLSYNALTRQYRLAFGALHQNFDNLTEAMAELGRVRNSLVVRSQEIETDRAYLAALRLRLDTSQLPKPLQIDALASNDWRLSSDWYVWTFKP
jgi:hypothetical protein